MPHPKDHYKQFYLPTTNHLATHGKVWVTEGLPNCANLIIIAHCVSKLLQQFRQEYKNALICERRLGCLFWYNTCSYAMQVYYW